MLLGSRIITWVSVLLTFAIPCLAAAYWSFAPDAEIIRSWFDGAAVREPLGVLGRSLAALACLPAIAFAVAALVQLRRCAVAVRSGQPFGETVSGSLRRLGWLTLALAPLLVLTSMLVAIALTYARPEGQRWIVVSVDTGTLVLVLTGALALLVSQLVAKARELADEHAFLV
jgi:hypothetical protein